ncbi:putative Zn-dependent protease [Massilia sp. UYP11]|uniref:M48 family metallopeptidase n=1 Tax=Massilia sp. UYP11 TaxID=1756385 RepID=UPI003D1B5E4E
MKYQASLPEHNDNISHEHPLKDFVLILAGLSAAIFAAYLALGWLVDVVVERMDPGTEARLTRLVAWTPPPAEAALRKHEAWAQALVDGMKTCAGVSEPVTVRITRSTSPNAMVAPGGLIVVHSALFDSVRSENGMAFVLAHELSHLAHRDHLRALGRRLVLVAAATLLTGDGSGAASVLLPAQTLGESRYSRGREAAADGKALDILQCRYGHAGGATEFFESLRRAEGDTPAFTHYLASHPSMDARIAALRAAIRQARMQSGAVRPLPRF